jgi:hypothetical protein
MSTWAEILNQSGNSMDKSCAADMSMWHILCGSICAQDYSMDCYFRQYWRDSRLSFLGPIKNLSLSIKMLERIWRPDTYFYNGKHSYVHTITVPNKLLRITQEGDILYSMRSVPQPSVLYPFERPRLMPIQKLRCLCQNLVSTYSCYIIVCQFLLPLLLFQVDNKGEMPDGTEKLPHGQTIMPTGSRQLYVHRATPYIRI